MPLVNYCRKCQAETPVGETCSYCGGKLAKTGEQLSFGMAVTPVRDWFNWNNLLRVALPVLGLVFVCTLLAEWAAAGPAGAAALLKQGFFWKMMGLLALVLLVCLTLLCLQGTEKVHYVLDKQGVHIRVYLPEDAGALRLYARFVTPQQVQALEDDRPPLEGLTLVRRVTLPWETVCRVKIWREGAMLLFYRPGFWQAAALHCPLEDLEQAEDYIRKKLKRFPKARISPQKAPKR